MSKKPMKKRSFDPSYGYSLDDLLAIEAPAEEEGYAEAWQSWHHKAIQLSPKPKLTDTGRDHGEWRIFDVYYQSTDGVQIGGWMLLPKSGKVKRGFVIGHGYGGRTEPVFDLPFKDAALLFFCARGISRSPHGTISDKPYWHVLHDIQDRERYIMRGCAEDIWLGVSALIRLFPQVKDHIGYIGTSFAGGVGAMALAWDKRIQRAYFSVPSFGNQPLRLQLKSLGSAFSLRRFERKNPGMASYTLAWYDAAIAARHIDIPVLCALAPIDPVVAPPGQFSIYNSLAGEKQLFLLEAGHMEYDNKEKQRKQLLTEIKKFFSKI